MPWNQLVVPTTVLWLVCTQPAPVNVVISSKPSLSGAQLGEACGVPVDVAVAVAVTVAVAVAVGVTLGQAPSVTLTVSTLHPVALTLLSDAIRNRSLIVCPATFGPRLARVVW